MSHTTKPHKHKYSGPILVLAELGSLVREYRKGWILYKTLFSVLTVIGLCIYFGIFARAKFDWGDIETFTGIVLCLMIVFSLGAEFDRRAKRGWAERYLNCIDAATKISFQRSTREGSVFTYQDPEFCQRHYELLCAAIDLCQEAGREFLGLRMKMNQTIDSARTDNLNELANRLGD